jgi:hypothetical protein
MVVVAAVVLLAILLSETDSFPLSSVLSKRASHARSNVGLLRASTLSGDDVSSSSFTALTKDGGVKKMTVDRGTGKKIETGDILAVAFEAKTTEGGVVFAKGEKEKFVYADGSFIKGWDIGVGSMKVGESAKFSVKAPYAYGNKGVSSVVPPDSDLELDVKILAWLGNQMKPESLFQKDLDIDPFIASSPEAIQADYDDMQESFKDKYEGNILQIYLRRIKNISFGFGGSGFFQSQSGERPPWYLNPNLTFPAMILFSMGTFAIVFLSGSIKEKGERAIDPDLTMATPPPSIMNQHQHLQDGYVLASGKQSLPAIPDSDVFA